MLDIKQIESFFPDHLRPFKKNLLREYLQYKILEAISESPFAGKLIFMGGTCIHMIHGSPRFSEDLDFDNPGIDRRDFQELSQRVKRTLELQGYAVELKTSLQESFRASLRFPGLLRAGGISGHRDEKLLIQIDTEPQKVQYSPDRFILNKFDVFSRISVVPADILLAQKIYCIFNRARPMGRDFFDVVFLLGKSGVNLDYLNEKLSIRNETELRDKLLQRCDHLDFVRLAKDIEPFVYSRKDLDRVSMFPDFIQQRDRFSRAGLP
jgi:predicted nucleotidyltransferase component of viral defense system